MESSNEHDLIAVTETWLNPCVRDSELLINTAFNIHCRDRDSGVLGGGVMLAVRNHLKSIRRSDLETDAELLACEIKPENRKKFLCLVFYRPPLSGIIALKALKQCLKKANNANNAHFTHFLVMGDFNLPDINWQTMATEHKDSLHTELVKIVRDNFLWQLIDQPTRGSNILDLLLTNFSDRVMS